MPEQIRFRPIDDEDRRFLHRLYASTRADELAAVDWTDEEKERFLDFQFGAQHDYYREQFPAARFDLVLVDGEPAGRLYVDRRDDEIRLIDIALLPEFRRRGIGGELMRRVLDEGREAGLPVQIHVEQNNPAMRLYDRLGLPQGGGSGGLRPDALGAGGLSPDRPEPACASDQASRRSPRGNAQAGRTTRARRVRSGSRAVRAKIGRIGFRPYDRRAGLA